MVLLRCTGAGGHHIWRVGAACRGRAAIASQGAAAGGRVLAVAAQLNARLGAAVHKLVGLNIKCCVAHACATGGQHLREVECMELEELDEPPSDWRCLKSAGQRVNAHRCSRFYSPSRPRVQLSARPCLQLPLAGTLECFSA